MSGEVSTTGITTALNAAADAPDPRLKKVARQFEGIFLQELFKGLEHEPEEGDLLGDSQASQMFNQLHHQALSDQAAGGSGALGIADLLYRKLLNTPKKLAD